MKVLGKQNHCWQLQHVLNIHFFLTLQKDLYFVTFGKVLTFKTGRSTPEWEEHGVLFEGVDHFRIWEEQPDRFENRKKQMALLVDNFNRVPVGQGSYSCLIRFISPISLHLVFATVIIYCDIISAFPVFPVTLREKNPNCSVFFNRKTCPAYCYQWNVHLFIMFCSISLQKIILVLGDRCRHNFLFQKEENMCHFHHFWYVLRKNHIVEVIFPVQYKSAHSVF